MCGTPKPVKEFGRIIMNYLVNQQFDLVDVEINKFEKKKYIICSITFSKKEYESPRFKKIADEAMKRAKQASKGGQCCGILMFFPSITKDSIFRLPRYDKIFWMLIHSSIDVNDSCRNSAVRNFTGKECDDTNLYLMVFYSK